MRVLTLVGALLIGHCLPAAADAPGQSPDQRLAELNTRVDGFLSRVATVDTRDPDKRDRQVTALRRDDRQH